MTAQLTTPSGASPEDRERHGMVYRPDHIEEHASAVVLAKDIADYLEKEYPGWLWALGVDSKGGIVTIRSLRLSAEWGYILKLDWVQHDPVVRRKLVLRAAGEILERYGCKPRPYRHEDFARITRDVAGRPKPDLSDRHTKIRRRYRDEALTAAVRKGEVKIQYGDVARADGSKYRRILIASGGKTPDVRR